MSDKIITCTEGRVEGGNLTLGKQYEVIYAYKDSYCIVDDSDELDVYNKCFFEKAQEQICYKTGEVCEYNCKGLCEDSY